MHGMVTTPLYLPMDRQVLANPGLLLAMAPTKVSKDHKSAKYNCVTDHFTLTPTNAWLILTLSH